MDAIRKRRLHQGTSTAAPPPLDICLLWSPPFPPPRRGYRPGFGTKVGA